MQIVLVVVRRVELHDQVDVVHVDAAGRDVGGDQDAGMPGDERVQGPLPLVLVAVAVDGRCIYAAARELYGATGAKAPEAPEIQVPDAATEGAAAT